jgi:hypothetical protein
MPLGTPAPTPGLAPLTPTADLTPSPTPGFVILTATPTPAALVPTPPPPPTAAPATSAPMGAISGEVHVRFGDPAFAELVSYSLPAAEVTTAQPLQLALTWRALDGRSPMDYVVFTHLRSGEGGIIAQHDGHPGGGSHPLSEWSPGETVVDVHPMVFEEAHRGYTGPATIVVGLYNPGAPQERVFTDRGVDYVTLVVVNIVP